MNNDNSNKATNAVLKWGVISALLASLCCIGPLALILLGIGGASTALSIGYQKPYFLAFGVLVLGIGFYKLHHKTCNSTHLTTKQQIILFGGAFLIAVLIYYLLSFVIAPLIAPIVYQFKFER